MHVVEADDGDVLRHPDPGRAQLAHRSDRHLVVAAGDGVGQFAARCGEKLADGPLAADRGEPSLEAPQQPHALVLRQGFGEDGAPFSRVRGFRRSGDVEQPGLSVLLDQMTGHCSGAGAVVGVDDIGMGFVGGASDQHDRDARRQPR